MQQNAAAASGCTTAEQSISEGVVGTNKDTGIIGAVKLSVF
jgi:hypothetical protein